MEKWCIENGDMKANKDQIDFTEKRARIESALKSVDDEEHEPPDCLQQVKSPRLCGIIYGPNGRIAAALCATVWKHLISRPNTTSLIWRMRST
jgi:hypothetical protein